MDSAFHYPPELLELLVETIPRLVKSKDALIIFFRGAGVATALTSDLEERLKTDRNGIRKFEIARTVLTRINEAGDRALGTRREVIKRVTEFSDFSSCYENDRLPAEGYVARVRHLVNVKDSFTRMNLEREAERGQRLKRLDAKQRELELKQAELAAIRGDLGALYTETDPYSRARALESLMNRLFKSAGISVREAFALTGENGEGIVEQVDGVIEIDGEIYLVETKWLRKALGVPEVTQHLSRLFARAEARGIVISAEGFGPPAVTTCKEALTQKVVVLCNLRGIQYVLEQGGDLCEYLKEKIHAAIVDKKPLHEPFQK